MASQIPFETSRILLFTNTRRRSFNTRDFSRTTTTLITLHKPWNLCVYKTAALSLLLTKSGNEKSKKLLQIPELLVLNRSIADITWKLFLSCCLLPRNQKDVKHGDILLALNKCNHSKFWSLLLFRVSISLMMKFDLQLNSCGFDPDNLDDWLESDLKQSGILPSGKTNMYNGIKLEDPDDWERHSCSDGSDDKTVVDELELDNRKSDTHTADTPLPTQLAPILKALAVLTSLHQQGAALPGLLPLAPSLSLPPPPPPHPSTTPLTPEAINPIHMTKTPRNLQQHDTTISPINTSNMTNNNNNTSSKRQRDSDTAYNKMELLDPLALKRQKNTDAARRSRQRKVMKMEGLESRVNELEKDNQQLLLKVAVAESERDAAKVKEAKQREKVAALEAQLAKSHQELLQRDQSKDQEKDDTSDTDN
ncbi:hypothetical protein BCR42DRAFT_396450 [Absidia repens]|uniref:BZIP domain-containing protein n=1 Tax=Absidia repens TaxID=90262 RepID=A0A1X2I3Y4_9FUNG|nr:hypothetical protein BCR42DRAFT_396450 [Absidia repens]